MDWFERAVEAEGRLLKVEKRRTRGGGVEPLAESFILTFDVARIRVWVDVANGTLACEQLAIDQPNDGSWGAADEEEPWWRLLGTPLVRCRETTSGVELQFRADDDGPRVLALAVEEGLVRSAVRNATLPLHTTP